MLSARKLIESVNTGETLTQEELFPLFARASHLVNDCVRLIVRESNYVQLRIVALGAEVAANLDRNKAIYRRSVAFVDGSVRDVPPDAEERQAEFLCRCMDLQRALLDADVDRQIDLILSLPLTRMVFEQIVKDWVAATNGYTEACIASSEAYAQGDLLRASAADAECHRIEQQCFLDPLSSFGVIRYVERRLDALRRIYDKIFNAYSRVILKLAKSQAISDDHSLDNFQNGSFGLLRATSSYDHVSNARFVGHARWWIRQSMLFYVKEDSNLIKVSSNTWQHYAKLEAIRSKLESQHGPLDDSDLSELSGYSKSHVETIYNTVRTSQVRSLDYPLKSDGGTSAMNLVESPDEVDILAYSPSDSVNVLLDNLPVDLRNLVCLHFGLIEYVAQELDPGKVEAERRRQQSSARTPLTRNP
jgi:DNA-directed RNA polymerase sigma subunit (sigma70/sigma32)